MVVAAEGAGADAALAMRWRVTSGSLVVSVERPARCTGPVEPSAALASSAIEGVPVIKRSAVGVVPVVVINCVVVVPIESPTTPAPSITSEEADSETGSEGEIRAAIPYAGIWVPSRPRHVGPPVNYPRIICGHVNNLGIGRLNDDGRALGGHGLLRRGLKIAGISRPLAHSLHRIHYILFLVVVGVSKGRRPGEVLVHISQDRRKCSKRLDAGVPGLLVHGLSQSVTLQIGMRLNPSVSLDDLLGKGGGRQDLGYQRIRIKRNRGDQLLQLLGGLLRVWRALRGLRRSLRVLIGRKILRPSRTQQCQRQQGHKDLPTHLRSRIPRADIDPVHVLEPPLNVRPVGRPTYIDWRAAVYVTPFARAYCSSP